MPDIQKDLRLVDFQNFFQEKLHTAKQDATVLGLLLMNAIDRLEKRNARMQSRVSLCNINKPKISLPGAVLFPNTTTRLAGLH